MLIWVNISLVLANLVLLLIVYAFYYQVNKDLKSLEKTYANERKTDMMLQNFYS